MNHFADINQKIPKELSPLIPPFSGESLQEKTGLLYTKTKPVNAPRFVGTPVIYNDGNFYWSCVYQNNQWLYRQLSIPYSTTAAPTATPAFAGAKAYYYNGTTLYEYTYLNGGWHYVTLT